jgi:hypothetical protein
VLPFLVLLIGKAYSSRPSLRVRVRLSGADRWMFSSDPYDQEKRSRAVERHGGDVLKAATASSVARPTR